MKENKRNLLLFIIGGMLLLVLVLGASYAYFGMAATSEITETTISGDSETVGNGVLTTNMSQLKLTLTPEAMHKDNIGEIFYATTNGVLTKEITTHNFATISLPDGDVALDCSFAFDVTVNTNGTITDGSDENIKVVFISSYEEKTYTLKEISAGVVYAGKVKKIAPGESKNIEIKMFVENTNVTQNNLEDVTYSISITPKSGNDGFSCKMPYNLAKSSKGQAAAPFMVANQSKIDGLWSSGLEGDGLRYVGPGTEKVCSYDNGAYYKSISKDTTACPSVIKYIATETGGLQWQAVYSDTCPEDTEWITYECTELKNVVIINAEVPDNFICFGTTSASECKANESKYMYRIIGVFPDEQGNQHLKLRKFKQLGSKKWNDTAADVNWGERTLYTELNGSYFLGNTTYDYLQNATWSDKIVEWKWTAVNTKTYSDNGPDYNIDSTMTPANIYLHEMNRSTKTSTVGEWTYSTGKIGLMYASDYVLSLGSDALAITGTTDDNKAKLKTGWLHYTNDGNSSSSSDWTIAREGTIGSNILVWSVTSTGSVYSSSVTRSYGVAPVFYLTSDIQLTGGKGTYEEPYIIKE